MIVAYPGHTRLFMVLINLSKTTTFKKTNKNGFQDQLSLNVD